jgi:hypothetical protein
VPALFSAETLNNLYRLLDEARDISAVLSVKLQIGRKCYKKLMNLMNFYFVFDVTLRVYPHRAG